MRAHKALAADGRRSLVAVLAALLLIAAFSGCFGGSDDDEDDAGDDGMDGMPGHDDDDDDSEPVDPSPPPAVFVVQAALIADRQAGWASEDTWTFDASNSTVISGEGNITRWTFDFGDGSDPVVVEDADELVVEHTYEEGGVYLVNLTVEGESADGEPANDTMSVAAFVSQRFAVEGEAADQIFLVDPGDEWNETFPVRFGAIGFNVTLQVEDTAAIGDSEGTVSFTAPGADKPMAQTEIEDGEVTFGGEFDLEDFETGDCLLEVTLDSGDIAFNGTLEIYYGLDPADQQ